MKAERPVEQLVVVVVRFVVWLAWSMVVVVAVVVVGAGLTRTGYFEPTSEAIATAKTGTRLIANASAVLLAAVGFAWWRGAPGWALITVLTVPMLCGGLTSACPQTLFPQLAYLGAAPVSAIGVIGALAQRWRRYGMTRLLVPRRRPQAG